MVSAILTGFLVFLIIFTKVSFVCICIYYQKAAHRRQIRDSLSLTSTTRRNNNNNDGRVNMPVPVLELLPPPFDYSAASAKSGIDCAVCLCELKDKESCRLLPNCKHVFHSQCIDLWFYSHSNCPLCRAMVWPIPSVGDGDIVTASNIRQEEANQTSLLPYPPLDEAMAIQMQEDCPKQVEMASSSNSNSGSS